jgi:hypothetical protein
MAKEAYVDEPLPLFGDKKRLDTGGSDDQEKHGAVAAHVATAEPSAQPKPEDRDIPERVAVLPPLLYPTLCFITN